MIRDELRRALEVLGDRLPDGEIVVLARRAFGDRGVSFLRGDVERVTGRPARVYEASVEEWAGIVHADDRQGVLERLSELPERTSLSLEYRVLQPEGDVRWIRESLRVIRAGPGSPPEIVGVLTDVTARRSARNRLSALEAELWRARKMESLGNLAAEVAHDFNNLLTAIFGSADLLRHGSELSGDDLEEIRVIRESATRGRDLVRRILQFAARRPGSTGDVDPAEAVRELEEILSRLAGPHVDVETDVPEEPWTVTVDRAHLEQVVLNLVTNAREAMPGGGRLTVSLENRELEEPLQTRGRTVVPGRYLCLTVRDTGTGISPEVEARLFEPFFTTKQEGEGGGFGLPNVLRIVEGYDGGIEIDSRPGEGSTFRVYLPVTDQPTSEAEGIQALETARIEEPDAGGLRILVLEDDPAVRDVVERVLGREGHTVIPVDSASEALRVFDRVRPPFDLLISDVVLPERSGPAVHRALARRVGELPVIFMSGYGRETAVREGMVDPDARFLDKPFSPGELVRMVDRVRAELGRGNGPDASSAGDAGS